MHMMRRVWTKPRLSSTKMATLFIYLENIVIIWCKGCKMYRSVERKATFLYCFVTVASLCSGQGKVEGGHLKWMYEAKNGFSPHDTPFAPAIFRGKSPGDDRVAVLSQTANGNWAVDGLSINSGAFQFPINK